MIIALAFQYRQLSSLNKPVTRTSLIPGIFPGNCVRYSVRQSPSQRTAVLGSSAIGPTRLLQLGNESIKAAP
jgi:hypothetical protein